MKVHLFGVQKVDFVGNDGKPVKGIKLHIGYPVGFVDGLKVDTKWISGIVCDQRSFTPDLFSSFIGGEVDLQCDLSGSVLDVLPA